MAYEVDTQYLNSLQPKDTGGGVCSALLEIRGGGARLEIRGCGWCALLLILIGGLTINFCESRDLPDKTFFEIMTVSSFGFTKF